MSLAWPDSEALFCLQCDDYTSREQCLCGSPCVLKFKDEFGDVHYYGLDHGEEIYPKEQE